jgi:hypothetical protein
MKTDIEPEGIPTDIRQMIRIDSIEAYERATARVAELSERPGDPVAKAELQTLTAVIMEWDKGHDDATSWG